MTFLRMINKKQHESVLEHASASFSIVADRGISHELVRHRIASYSQSSTRYCDYNSGKFDHEISVIKPVDLPEPGPAYDAWKAACSEAERQYKVMRRYGVSAQIARSVLPTCLMTEVFMTANFREWRHFLNLRLSLGAHPDMRVVAGCIRDALVQSAPTVFEEWASPVQP